MGCDRQVPWLSVWESVYRLNRQQSSHLCAHHSQTGCYGPSLGCVPLLLQFWHCIQIRCQQCRCWCSVPHHMATEASGSCQALCHQVTTDCSTVESYGLDDEIVPDDLAASYLVGTVDWLKEQSADPAIATVVQCISDGQPWPSGSGCSPELRSLLREKARLRVRKDLLYRERTTEDRESPQTEFQLIIPPQCRKAAGRVGAWQGWPYGARTHSVFVAS